METIYFSETLGSNYKPTQHHNPKGQHQHLYHREKLNSHKVTPVIITTVDFEEVKRAISESYLVMLLKQSLFTMSLV
jgi:hypothetical protein